ncbi:tkl protein kinase [Plasmopara halstedii]|uniref:Tkl protein kinase n=1 Tax=Plasmopara halstedii TaxID=4781 RepID=A0A0P1AKS4_PLAHL|nr:tkl protein kinase [Plasmopara halstedii]CEG41724.1 tkl protein kinase [Plasmopara halstedii]|eukprot:XP_024578093.1 tkl protein kinase [Plasmopara halstedii]
MISWCCTAAKERKTSTKCSARCALDAASCLQNGECTFPLEKTVKADWRVVLQDAPIYYFDTVVLLPWVETLEIIGNKTRVVFNDVHPWTGKHLTAVSFAGLDFTDSPLPLMPHSVTHLQFVNCVFNQFSIAWIMSLSELKSLVLKNNSLSDETQILMELSERQFQVLRSRLSDGSIHQDEIDEEGMSKCTVLRGRIRRLGGFNVCIMPDEEATVTRQLQTHVDSVFFNSEEDDTTFQEDEVKTSEQDTPTLVLISMALPFIYFLYKVVLYISFARASHRDSNSDVSPVTNSKVVDINEQERSTANVSTTSPTVSPVQRAHRKEKKSFFFGTENADFWVDEELQQWRLNFHRLKLLKWLNVPTDEKRQTLRKQSVTTTINPHEIWLASLASNEQAVVGSSEKTFVVAKFLPPKENSGRRSSTCGTRDKLKSEVKRQAQLNHPQVVSFIGVAWSRGTNLVAITEYMTQGDLRQWLRRTAVTHSGKWTVSKVQMLLDVSSALLYIHSVLPHSVHGNCNSRNVLLNDSLRAKLSDFGIDSRSDGFTDQELTSYSIVGSGRWISPEALLGRETCATYPDASDVYSFGILVAEVDSHELPFSDLLQANRSAVPESDILQLIARGALSPTLSPGCPQSIVKLVNACTSYNPKHRPRSAQMQQDLLRILDEIRAISNDATAPIAGDVPSRSRTSATK